MPTFELSCRSMFEHVDSVFKRGMEEHVVIAQQQFSSMHSPLASILQVSWQSARRRTVSTVSSGAFLDEYSWRPRLTNLRPSGWV